MVVWYSFKNQILITVYSRHYIEARNERRGTPPAPHRLGNTASKKRRGGGQPFATLCQI